MLLLSQDVALSRVYSSAMFFEKILWSFQGFISVPYQPSGWRGIPSGRSLVSNIRPDDEIFPSRHPSVSKSFEQFKVSSVRTLFRVREDPSVLAHPSGRRGYTVRTPFSVWQELRFLPQDTVMGKTAATVRTMCDPVRTMSSIRQVVHFKFNRPDVSLHGLDDQASNMEITCTSSTVRTLQALLW
jgi:hypothetical protein